MLESLVDVVGITHLTRLMPNYAVPRALHIKSNTKVLTCKYDSSALAYKDREKYCK
jgi:hypothetical protein